MLPPRRSFDPSIPSGTDETPALRGTHGVDVRYVSENFNGDAIDGGRHRRVVLPFRMNHSPAVLAMQ